MKGRRITGYEREVADRLKHTYLPFSYKIAHFVLDEDIGDIDLLRILADTIIHLETRLSKPSLQNPKVPYTIIDDPITDKSNIKEHPDIKAIDTLEPKNKL